MSDGTCGGSSEKGHVSHCTVLPESSSQSVFLCHSLDKTFLCLSMAFRVIAKLFLQLTSIHTPLYAQHTGLLAIRNFLIRTPSLLRACVCGAPSSWKATSTSSNRSQLLVNLHISAQGQLQGPFLTFKLSPSVMCTLPLPPCTVPHQPVTPWKDLAFICEVLETVLHSGTDT